ncbi:hypothetical protein ABZV75_15040 [Streptomyces flaveolus]|uniref:hypothetical protein n=1 Tax=Streptomyces flaveolus TaxID=67297 RepID=UPI0033AA383C
MRRRRLRAALTAAALATATLVTLPAVVPPATAAPAPAATARTSGHRPAAAPDRSTAVVDSTMARYTPDTIGDWSYPVGPYLYGQYLARLSVGADGRTQLAGVSVGTNVGDCTYYVGRIRAANGFHGLGAFLITNEQLRAEGVS